MSGEEDRNIWVRRLLGLGILNVLFVWIALENAEGLSRVEHLLMALVVSGHLLFLVLAKYSPVSPVHLARMIIFSVACVLFALTALGLYGAAKTHIEIVSVYIWIPVFYVVAFILLDHRAGLIASVLAFFVLLFISLPYVFFGEEGAFKRLTIKMYAASVVTVMVLHHFSRLQQELRCSQDRR